MAPPSDHHRVGRTTVLSQPRLICISARSRHSFGCRPLPSIFLADLNQVEWRVPGGSRAGGSAIWPVGTEVVSSPVVPVLSFLTGLQGRFDLRGFSVPARVQRPLVMG